MTKLLVTILLSTFLSTNAFSSKFFFKDNFLTYYTTHDFLLKNTKIKRLVIVVHGALRNGDEYFTDTVAAAQKHGVSSSTMIVAPHFRKVTDQREPGEIYYGRRWYTKWKYGYISQDSDKVSSFTLIDKIIEQIGKSNKFPNLANIVVTGHSAGGQFTQRYAVGTRIQESVSAVVEFVPSNPSSYMYLDSERFNFTNGHFEMVTSSENCEDYNHYIYGPINRAVYLNHYSIEQLKLIFSTNKVTYLMSEEDKGTASLDRSCGAMIQGKNRIERAKNYFHYDQLFIGGHKFIGVPGIAHDHVGVYESRQAASVVFGL
jgi:hypothetical protein